MLLYGNQDHFNLRDHIKTLPVKKQQSFYSWHESIFTQLYNIDLNVKQKDLIKTAVKMFSKELSQKDRKNLFYQSQLKVQFSNHYRVTVSEIQTHLLNERENLIKVYEESFKDYLEKHISVKMLSIENIINKISNYAFRFRRKI